MFLRNYTCLFYHKVAISALKPAEFEGWIARAAFCSYSGAASSTAVSSYVTCRASHRICIVPLTERNALCRYC